MAFQVGPCVRCKSEESEKGKLFRHWTILDEGWVCGVCLPETPTKSVTCPHCEGTGSIQVPDQDIAHKSTER